VVLARVDPFGKKDTTGDDGTLETDRRPERLLQYFSGMLEKLSSVEDKITGEYQFAFRKTYQAAEVCFVMRQMTEKAREFGKHFWMMDADIWKAYDTVEHDEFAAAADEVGVHRACTAAVIREMRRACSVVQLPGIGRSRPVRRLRSFFQGDPEAPRRFNLTLQQRVVEPFERLCDEQGWGIEIGHTDLAELDAQIAQPKKKTRISAKTQRMPIMLFAYNYWLFGESREMLRRMADAFHQLLWSAVFL